MRHDLPPEAKGSRNLRRIAIWNRSKIIIAITMSIWLTDLALLLYGKYPLQIMGGSPVYLVIP
jgi:hypothetical protein